MQVQIIQTKSGQSHTNYRNVFHAGYSIMQQHRLKGAYQGIIATCLRNTPASGIYFGFMETVKHHFTPASGGAPPKWAVFMAGGTGGFFYWFLTYPTDVVKSSMMSDATELSKRKYSGYIDCAQQIYKEGGLKNFFRGFTPCLLRAIPANGVMIFLVDQCRVLLGT
ncbi:hypothetical protein NP493_815g02070 [Ridgeia piscesae]|nr:hypothetical protein NP493_815g02070 [Ridgeia piscesae]